MNRGNKTRKQVLGGLLMVVLLFLSTVATISVAENGSDETTVERILPNIGFCGEPAEVALRVEPGDANQIFIEENLPEGLEVSEVSDGGVHDEDNNRIRWVVEGQTPTEISYILSNILDPGSVVIKPGVFLDVPPIGPSETKAIEGDTSFPVTCAEAKIEREPLALSECGGTTMVDLSIDWGDANGAWIEETAPPGWSISNPSNGGTVQSDGSVRWGLDPSVTQVSYQVTIPTTAAGTHLFSGSYVDDSMGQSSSIHAPVRGDDTMDVACGTSVVRSEFGSLQCGDTFTHELVVDWDGAGKIFIEEGLPPGWTASNPSHGGSLQSDKKIRWLLEASGFGSPVKVSADVEIPGTAEGEFPFSGEFLTDDGSASKSILGPGTITVSCGDPPDNGGSGPGDGGSGTLMDATAQRNSFSTIHPGQSREVRLNVNPRDANFAEIRETLPGAGFSATGISNGGFLAGDTLQWDLSGATANTLIYQLHVVDTANLAIFGVWTYSGNVMDDIKASPAAISGDGSFLVVHRYDSNQNCMFSDDGLFTLIDDWKAQQATDNELFSGIDAWKRLPGTYC